MTEAADGATADAADAADAVALVPPVAPGGDSAPHPASTTDVNAAIARMDLPFRMLVRSLMFMA
jgi:hypothetical protein